MKVTHTHTHTKGTHACVQSVSHQNTVITFCEKYSTHTHTHCPLTQLSNTPLLIIIIIFIIIIFYLLLLYVSRYGVRGLVVGGGVG